MICKDVDIFISAILLDQTSLKLDKAVLINEKK